MIKVKFFGGAKKSFPAELEIENSDISLEKLLSIILQKNPQSTIDVENILIAVNGIDSSALEGLSTILKDNDVISIIPIIHGGSQIIRLHILKKDIMIIKSNKINLDELRKDFPKIKFQAISDRFILDRYHLEKIISLSLYSEKYHILLSNKLEMDILMRFAISGQISNAIKTAGIQYNQDFFLIAIGTTKILDKLLKTIPHIDIFTRDNSSFLKKHFHLTQKQLNLIQTDNPLADILVERAAVLQKY